MLQTELNRLTSGLYCPSIRKLRDELWEDVIQLQSNDAIDNIVHDSIKLRSSTAHVAGSIRWELFERTKHYEK
jgi:hypothetical protein